MKLHLPKLLLTAVVAAAFMADKAEAARYLITDDASAESYTLVAGADDLLYANNDADGYITSNANITVSGDGDLIWIGPGTDSSRSPSSSFTEVTLNGQINGNAGTLQFNIYGQPVVYRLTNSNSSFAGTIQTGRGTNESGIVQVSFAGTGEAYKNALLDHRDNETGVFSIEGNTSIRGLNGGNGSSRVTSTSDLNTLTINTAGNNYSWSGAVGSGSYYAASSTTTTDSTALNLVKTGDGTQTLTGATNLKNVTVTGGKLVLSGSAKLGSGDLTITGATVEASFTSSSGTSVLGGGTTANIGKGGTLKLSGHDMLGWGNNSPAKIILGSDDSTALATFEIADTAVCTLKPALEMNGNSRITGTKFNTFGSSLTVTNKNNIISVGEIQLRELFNITVDEGAELEISSVFSTHTDNAGAVTKKGVGKLVLSGEDSVIGNVLTVEAGSLEITKEITVKDNVTVNEGATLVIGDLITNAGSGTITLNGNVVINNSDTYELYEASSVAYSAGENGFRTSSGGKYWLIEGGTVDISNIGSVTLDGTETTTEIIQIETGGAVFSKGTAVTSAEYYVNTTVSSDVHETATYYLNSETAVLNVASSLSNSRIAGAAGAVNVTEGNTLQLDTEADNLKHILTTATGDGDVELSTYVNLQTGDSTSITGKLVILAGGELRLGGEGDAGATNSTPDVSTLNVELNGGKLTTRGFQGSLNSVTVSSVTEGQSYAELYIADTTAADNVPASFTIGKLAVNADLNLKTNWKSSLIVNWLTGSEDINFVGHQSDEAGHHLRVNSVDGYTGVITMQNHSGNKGFLTMNIKEGESLNASQIKACNNSSVVIDGAGTYNLGSQTFIAGYTYTPAATEAEPNPTAVTDERGSLASTWTGTVSLTGATLDNANLNDYGNANSTVELSSATGSLAEGTINTNVKFTSGKSGGNATPGMRVTTTTGKTVTFAGSVTSNGTNGNLVVEAPADNISGTDTYVFTGDVSGWTGKLIGGSDVNVKYEGNATSVKNDIAVANSSTVNVTYGGDKAVTVNGYVDKTPWDGASGTINIKVENTSTEGVTFTNTVEVSSTNLADGTTASFNGTSNLGSLTLGAGATITGTGNLTIGELILDLQSYTTDFSQIHTLVSTTGTLNFTGSLDAYQGATVGEYTAKVEQSGNSITLSFSDIVAPDTNNITTTVSSFGGITEGMLTLNVGADLTDATKVLISGISDSIMAEILGNANLPEGGMVGITLAGANESTYTATADQMIGFQANDGVSYYYGEAGTGNVGWVYQAAYIPEPTTATLSLLALAGLAARRRRK